jgi:hypothetical protein
VLKRKPTHMSAPDYVEMLRHERVPHASTEPPRRDRSPDSAYADSTSTTSGASNSSVPRSTFSNLTEQTTSSNNDTEEETLQYSRTNRAEHQVNGQQLASSNTILTPRPQQRREPESGYLQPREPGGSATASNTGKQSASKLLPPTANTSTTSRQALQRRPGAEMGYQRSELPAHSGNMENALQIREQTAGVQTGKTYCLLCRAAIASGINMPCGHPICKKCEKPSGSLCSLNNCHRPVDYVMNLYQV